jgi:hypothetical protein
MSDTIKPEPQEAGQTGEQAQAAPSSELVRADTHPGSGMTPTWFEEFQQNLPLREGVRRLAEIVGRGLDRDLRDCEERIRHLTDDLADERVAHGRTDKRLKTAKGQSGAQVLVQALGGACFGGVLAEVIGGRFTWGLPIITLIGLVLFAFGSWPVIRARTWKP